jgi:hypothetical protein
MLEIADTFGEHDIRQKIMGLLIHACQCHETIDLTYVGDICDFIISNIYHSSFFDNTTVSLNGTIIKLRELSAMIEKQCDTKDILKVGCQLIS